MPTPRSRSSPARIVYSRKDEITEPAEFDKKHQLINKEDQGSRLSEGTISSRPGLMHVQQEELQPKKQDKKDREYRPPGIYALYDQINSHVLELRKKGIVDKEQIRQEILESLQNNRYENTEELILIFHDYYGSRISGLQKKYIAAAALSPKKAAEVRILGENPELVLQAMYQAVIHAIALSYEKKDFSLYIQFTVKSQLNQAVRSYLKKAEERYAKAAYVIERIIGSYKWLTREDYLEPQVEAGLTPGQEFAVRMKHSITFDSTGQMQKVPTNEQIALAISEIRSAKRDPGITMSRAQQLVTRAEQRIRAAYLRNGILEERKRLYIEAQNNQHILIYMENGRFLVERRELNALNLTSWELEPTVSTYYIKRIQEPLFQKIREQRPLDRQNVENMEEAGKIILGWMKEHEKTYPKAGIVLQTYGIYKESLEKQLFPD